MTTSKYLVTLVSSTVYDVWSRTRSGRNVRKVRPRTIDSALDIWEYCGSLSDRQEFNNQFEDLKMYPNIRSRNAALPEKTTRRSAEIILKCGWPLKPIAKYDVIQEPTIQVRIQQHKSWPIHCRPSSI